jgi:RNA-directed DNA polymerase
LRFTALLHHIYNLETLRMAYFRLKKDAAPGVDGETWQHYGEQLEGNLQDLSDRLKRGAYRIRVEEGTPQGGSASPLLANVYLHYGAPG